MSGTKSTYRQIAKTTSIFGGVQVLLILTSIIRGKFAAVFLGTAGMGVYALLNSASTILIQISSMGINFSAVRDISQATENGIDVNRKLTVFIRLVTACSIFGLILTFIFSSVLSKLSFGSYDYSGTFMWLSIAVMLNILSNATTTILQGLRKLKEMAKASLVGAVTSVIFCVPLYYYFKNSGIVAVFIAAAIVTVSSGLYFVLRTGIVFQKISIRDTFKDGSEMIGLGLVLMISSLIGSAVSYGTDAFIRHLGSLSDVGLYGAGISITNQYIGIIFTAMSVDYFPRLSAIAHDNIRVAETVNQQAEMVVLLSTPLLIFMMLTAPVLIRILLSTQFLPILDFVLWVAFAMLFKAASYSVGYISFAKGDKTTFFIFEGIINSAMFLIANICGYKIGGLIGVAVATLICYLIYNITVSIVAFKRYEFAYTKDFLIIFGISILLAAIALITSLLLKNLYGYGITTVILILSILYSYKQLNERIRFKDLISSKLKQKTA
ncbi:oligosaccharide flippase family protein [Mucilaginibacter psychrotolerans]|uniref:O-antigen translocase n=1 Tax=Mucilaginibacter psychrotolerans TaxID=1524096 RepID=A0A4Y8SAR0_9SPHI|nr:oligosaccharide flippase family protein [Mucilaginibacter psychrotolerans]TFF35524.1 O-antigen translocase [Mucilaginibacter psychrotolerans]